MAFDTGDDNGSETNKSTETTDNNESVDSEVSVESGDKGTDLVSNPESGLTGKDTELVEGNPIPSPSKSTELCESNEKKDNVSYSKSKNDTQKDSIKKANEKTEIANMSEEDIGKEDIFDKETGRFNTGYYGELNYNPETVKENLYITNGMMNEVPKQVCCKGTLQACTEAVQPLWYDCHKSCSHEAFKDIQTGILDVSLP